MNENIVKFPDRSAIEEEAAAWLITLDRKRAPSTDELAALREWMERSPLHREELASMASLWDKMNVLTELAVPQGKPGPQSKSASRPGQGVFQGFGWVGVTAAAIVLGFAVISTHWIRPAPLATNGLYATAIGQQQTTTLADGSVVLLNTNSQINIEYGKQYRVVHLLQGEVHFTVSKDVERPFRVYAANGVVEAVGTAFSVYLNNNAVDVTVNEGSVTLALLRNPVNPGFQQETAPSDNDQSIRGIATSNAYVTDLGILNAGQSTTIRPSNGNGISTQGNLGEIQTIGVQELSKRLSWREGMLTFNGDPLEEVVGEISRYTTVTIEISDPAVRDIKVGGRFPVGETDAMLEAFEANFGLRVTRLTPDHVLISAAEIQ